jgi:Intracellular proteinase inhibitor
MRILILMILFFIPMMTKPEGSGVENLNYQFTVIPIVGPESVELELVLRNEENFPLHFEFPTSQLFEITIYDSSGREVYVYSKGRYFLQAFQTLSLEPQDTHTIIQKWDYHSDGKRVPPGEYQVTVSLKPINMNGKPIPNRQKLTSIQKLMVPEENPAFRHVKVSGKNGRYVVSGEVSADTYFYSVENGHNEYIKEHQIRAQGVGKWEPFSLNIEVPPEAVPKNGSLLLNLYQKNKNGEIVNHYPVVLERRP